MQQHPAINITYTKKKSQISLVQKYLDFCDKQMKDRTLWYLIPLVSLPTMIMPMGILLMSYSFLFVPFAGLSILLLFANIILNIGAQHTRITITFYLITILIHIIVPLLSLIF